MKKILSTLFLPLILLSCASLEEAGKVLRNEKINYKVREHSIAKVPYIIVCGKKEVAENTVTVRKLGSDKQQNMKREDLIKNMLEMNKLPLN